MDYNQTIVTPINDEQVCGENLEDDSGYQNFFFEAQGTPEKYDGQTTVAAEPPDWRTVKKNALTHLQQTKDIKLISVLAQAVLNTEGVVKFAECLEGLAGIIDSEWANFYPPLDEDDGDPMERISALGYLTDNSFILNTLKNLPLARSKILGPISLKQIDRANDSSIEKTDSDVDITQIKAIFKDSEQQELIDLHQACQRCVGFLNAIDNSFITNASNQYSVDFDSLLKLLTHIINSLEKHADIAPEPTENSLENTEEIDGEMNDDENYQKSEKRLSFSSQQFKLHSRQDVEQCIELINEYFAEHEPSSPVPILMNRAKKLVHLDFVQIMKEIAPDALEQINKLGGLESE